MPSYSRAALNNTKSKPESTFEQADIDYAVAEQEAGTRASRRKSKNAAAKQLINFNGAEKTADQEAARDNSPSPAKPQSILGQLPQTFPHRTGSTDLDILEELNTSEKVSDEHTPPQDAWLPPGPNDRNPPTDLITGLTHTGSPPIQQTYLGRGGFSNTRSPPVSPPQAKARPVSYGGPTHSYAMHPRVSTSPYGYVGSAYGSPPALPHLPQQHFYGAHDVDLGVGVGALPTKQHQQSLIQFAQMPGARRDQREALLLGFENQLDVLSYDGEKLEHVGNLSGLRGTILDAVFLTWNGGIDPFEGLRPLIALTLHGPAGDIPSTDGRSASGMSNQEPATNHLYFMSGQESLFVTTVVVYSLRERTLVAELLRTPPAPSAQTLRVSSPQKASPAPRITLQASGNYFCATSALSGEIYAFGVNRTTSGAQFECLGKFWTTVQPRLQRRDSSHGRMSDPDVQNAEIGRGLDDGELPIVSLSGRWLAYCPANIPSRPSLGASVGESVQLNRSTNVSAGTAPTRPSPNCEVESPDVETFLGKMARGVAQELLKGSKWLGEKGMQTFQSYWRRDSTSSPSPPANPYGSPVYSPQPPAPQFPPTHADLAYAASKEPELVTIVDLKILQLREGKKQPEALASLATFQLPGGCSFLSFTPNGLGLLTASRKGDVQYVWDLVQLRYPRSTIFPIEADTGRSSARVRQIAKYARLSPSIIVEVAWEAPIGGRFAVLTQNRTIHMFDLPANALRWPPPRVQRRIRPVSSTLDSQPPNTQNEQSGAGGIIASAISLAGKTQPMLANLRGRAPSMGGGFSGIGASGFGLASATGVRGGKAVAAGLSKSLGAATDTVAHIRHAGQSKLHLKIDAVAGRLSWHWRGQRPVLSVLDSSGIRNYYVRKTKPRENRQLETVSVFDARKAIGIKLPATLTPPSDATPAHTSDSDYPDRMTTTNGFWTSVSNDQQPLPGIPPPLSHAEIETNAPYQPFHSDHRVTMSIYPEDRQLTDSELPTASVIFQPRSLTNAMRVPEPWVFGTDVPTTRLNIGSSRRDEMDDGQYGSVIYRETTMAPAADEEGMEQIVSTTRRRKGKKNGDLQWDDQASADKSGFFEDDCDVLDFATDRV